MLNGRVSARRKRHSGGSPAYFKMPSRLVRELDSVVM